MNRFSKKTRWMSLLVGALLMGCGLTASGQSRSDNQPSQRLSEAIVETKGLVALWDFSDASDLFTSIGFQQTSNTCQRYTLTAPEGAAPTVIEGEGPISGRALLFDGKEQYLTLPYAETGALNVHTGEVTVMAWVKWSGKDCSFVAGMWNEYEDGGKRQYGLFASLPYYNGGGQTCGHISQSGGPTPPFPYSIDYSADSQMIPTDRWCCIAFTYDGRHIRSFTDGVMGRRPKELLDHTEGFPGYPKGLKRCKNPYPFREGIGDNGSDFTMGAVRLASGMGNFFEGMIGGVAVFDRALTKKEIQRLSRQTHNGKQ